MSRWDSLDAAAMDAPNQAIHLPSRNGMLMKNPAMFITKAISMRTATAWMRLFTAQRQAGTTVAQLSHVTYMHHGTGFIQYTAI